MRRFLLAFILLAIPGGLHAAEVGSIAALRGEVSIVRDGAASAAEAGMRLMPGDRVTTGRRGMALLQFRGGLTLTVARDTELVVGDAAPSAIAATMAGWLELVDGLLRAVLSAPREEREVDVRTPLAVTSVRSTEWTVQHEDDHTAVFCRVGSVAVAAAGEEVTLAEGDGTDVRGSAPPSAPVQWGEPRVADTLARTTLAAP
jgi:hypothetical protein